MEKLMRREIENILRYNRIPLTDITKSTYKYYDGAEEEVYLINLKNKDTNIQSSIFRELKCNIGWLNNIQICIYSGTFIKKATSNHLF